MNGIMNIQEDGAYGIPGKGAQHDYQLSATAAYHTATRPRVYHYPRSCPGELSSNQYDAYSGVPDRSRYPDITIPGEMVCNNFCHLLLTLLI